MRLDKHTRKFIIVANKSSSRGKPFNQRKTPTSVTSVVSVTAKGFRYGDDVYRSLSAAARAITGARWSGPRFFGLDRGALTDASS